MRDFRAEILAYRSTLQAAYRVEPVASERAQLLIEITVCNQALDSSLELEAPERAAPPSSTTYRVVNVAPERVRTPVSVRAVPRTPTVLGIGIPPSSRPGGAW